MRFLTAGLAGAGVGFCLACGFATFIGLANDYGWGQYWESRIWGVYVLAIAVCSGVGLAIEASRKAR